MAETQSENHGHGPEAHEGGHAPPRPFRRLRQLLLPERRDLATVVVFAGAVATLSLAAPIAVESLVNTVAFGVLIWPVAVIAGILFCCLGLAAAIRAMQVYSVECLQRRLFVRVVADYAGRLPRTRLDAFDKQYGPELANRFFDILTLQKSLAFLLLDGVALVVTAVVGMVVLAFYHPFLLGFDILLVAAIAFILFVLGWGGVRTSLRESHAKYDVAAWLQELVRDPRTFKFAGGPQFALAKADRLAGEYIEARKSHFRVVLRQTVFSLGLQVVASTALLGLGGYLVIERQLTLGQLVASELIVALVVVSVSKLGKYAEAYYDLLTASEKLGLVTDLPPEHDGGESLADSGRGLAIRVHGVHSVSHRNLPTAADWHADPHERIAFVGPSGSDLTTLFEMLCGLRAADAGSVEIDGVDLRALAAHELRGQCALVERADVFEGTVSENLQYGREEVSPVVVREALRVVGLLGVVYALPLGIETKLIPGGGLLTPGQTLRLAIARAIVGRPRLLILDGVLDRLAPSDSPDLLPGLFDRTAPWTLLVASADPAIIGLCDRIVTLPRGETP